MTSPNAWLPPPSRPLKMWPSRHRSRWNRERGRLCHIRRALGTFLAAWQNDSPVVLDLRRHAG